MFLLICFGDRSSHQRCSVKKLFLKIWPISSENTCVGFLFLLCCRPFKPFWRTSVNDCFCGEHSSQSCIIQSRFKSLLFGLHVFFAFFRNKFLINLRRQFRVRKIYFLCVKFFVHRFIRDLQLFRKCVTYVLVCSFIKTYSLKGC